MNIFKTMASACLIAVIAGGMTPALASCSSGSCHNVSVTSVFDNAIDAVTADEVREVVNEVADVLADAGYTEEANQLRDDGVSAADVEAAKGETKAFVRAIMSDGNIVNTYSVNANGGTALVNIVDGDGNVIVSDFPFTTMTVAHAGGSMSMGCSKTNWAAGAQSCN